MLLIVVMVLLIMLIVLFIITRKKHAQKQPSQPLDENNDPSTQHAQNQPSKSDEEHAQKQPSQSNKEVYIKDFLEDVNINSPDNIQKLADKTQPFSHDIRYAAQKYDADHAPKGTKLTQAQIDLLNEEYSSVELDKELTQVDVSDPPNELSDSELSDFDIDDPANDPKSL